MQENKIHISPVCGLCYGSNNAISKTRELLRSHKNIVLYKEILHNENVIKELANNGAIIKNDLNDITKNDNFLHYFKCIREGCVGTTPPFKNI